ncbi:MAG: glycosyltransferase family 39 protein [Candidatus Daviesbacteria bacterium]|nr:glycosyltransferase family 39 protein [Candidatus Daviesbacteria bacterium]
MQLAFLEKIIGKYWLLILFILSIPAIWALLVPGFYGASDDLHISWLFEMDRSLQAGQFPPRFVPDLSFGFGYPLFNFVFPLPFYIGEIFHKLGLSFVDSIKGVFLLSFLLSAIFMYCLLKEFTSKILSFTGALIYLYTPYRSTDVYIRGAVGEALSFVFFPLTILSIYKLSQKNNFRWVGIGALSILGLILSHNIAAYMFLPLAATFGLFLLLANLKDFKTIFLKFVGMFLLGLISTSYFWLPALQDNSLMKYDTIFDFKDHFPTLIQLIKPYFGYGASVPGPYDGMSFFLGTANILLVVIALVSLGLFRKKYSSIQIIILIWSFISLGLAIFMMNYRSTFIWENIPLLPYFQFPWRYLMVTTFITPLLLISLEISRFKQAFAVVLLAAVVLINWSYFKPHDFLGRMDAYYLNRYIPYPEASMDYKLTKEEYLRLPKETSQRPSQNYPLIFPKDNLNIEVKEINSLHQIINISSSKEQVINYSKYNFPGWSLKVNGIHMVIKTGQPFGQISFVLPQGNSTIEILFQETGFKLILDVVSVVGLILAIYLATGVPLLKKRSYV